MVWSRRALLQITIAGTALGAGPAKATEPAARKKVAFLLDRGATVIDFCGPWEVFQDAGAAGPGFELSIVAPTLDPIRASGGMTLIPDFTLETAPRPDIIVIPAQEGGRDPAYRGAKVDWLRERGAAAEAVLSVCTGAFLLAKTGLLDGKQATTHHLFLDEFEKAFPHVSLVRGRRFVDNGAMLTTAGLTSGVDGALHLLERLSGRAEAERVASYMEHESDRWRTGV